MRTSKRYAIIDGAIEEGVTVFLAQEKAPNCCLYAEPIQPELITLAPYLVEVTPEVEAWLAIRETPWGIIITSELSLQKLQQHLRLFLWVMIPDQDKSVLFRFYDPRNMGALLEVLTGRELQLFTLPVQKITAIFNGINQEFNFSPQVTDATTAEGENKEVFPLRFTRRQYEKLNMQSQKNYVHELAGFIKQIVTDSPISESHLAEEYFLFCQAYDITDDNSVKQMIRLLLNENIRDTQDIPDNWLEVLGDTVRPGYRRVQQLTADKGL